ncbi:lysylphosphatidylglycerol synthase transmembrane domain-containing protein [Methylomagnum sp.]
MLVGITVAGFFSYLFLVGTDFKQIKPVLSQSSVIDLVAALLLLAAGHAIRIFRWAWLLRPVNPSVSPALCVVPYGSAMAVNNLLPLRAGDVYRVAGFSRLLGSSSGQVLGTVLVERVLDLLILVIFAAVGLPGALSGAAGQEFSKQSWLPITAIGLAGFLALSLAPRLACAYRRAYPETTRQSWGWHRTIHPIASQLANAVEGFGSPGVWMPAMVLSMLAWLCSGAVFIVVAGNYLQSAPFWAAWFSMAVGNLGTLLPGAPGAVGTFHYFAALGLLSYGVNWNFAVAAVVVVHLVQWLSTTAFGLACLGWNAVNKRQATARQPS